jgi:hypothetical protein
VRAPAEQQATDCSFWVDGHLTDRIHDEVPSVVVHAYDGDDLHRHGDVA